MLTDRFPRALAFAGRVHRNQVRKGTDVPYISHLLAVSARVLEWRADEDVAIAALLHDAVEDQGGLPTLKTIRVRFGDRVARMVLECSDSVTVSGEKPAWRERKQSYIASLRAKSDGAALITAADKLHNLECLVTDLERDGPRTLERFTVPGELGWYYSGVAAALASRAAPPPLELLFRYLERFNALVSGPTASSVMSA